MARGSRQLAAMMLTDMVGYSALTQQNERRALQLVREQERILRSIFRSFRGRPIKSLGDGFLVEFVSALDAVKCAIEVQGAIHRRNSRVPGEPIELRIGIHLGDVIHRGGDVFGDAVNIVARIEPLAEPGGACLSQPVYDQVRSNLDVSFVPLGSPPLKNISAPIPLYRIALPSSHPTAPTPKKDRPRLAVLPLMNISGQAEDEYFADGVTEELIQMLSRIAGLGVIARTSMMRFKNSGRAPSDVARELGASAVVEGGIRRAGSRIRVTARLIDASNEETLWSQSYDREFRDVFGLQSEISHQIADALEVEVLRTERNVLRRVSTLNPDAHALYLKGKYFLNRRTEESLRQALDSFQRSVRKDPQFAPAYAGIADAYSTLAWLEFLRPRFAFPRARAAAQRAVAIDPTLAEAHASLGFVRFLYERDWLGAESEFRQSIDLNPNYPTAHQFYSDFLKAMGRLDEALSEIRRALELDPLSLGINTALGHVLYLSRQYDPAIEQYRRTLELDPNFVQTHLWFGRPYLEKGLFDRAIEELRTAAQLSNDSTMSLAVLGHAYASAGRSLEARELLDRLMRRARSQYVPSYWIALIHAGLGDRDETFTWLERANRERSAWLAWVKIEPRFDRLREDPRFPRLLRRLKLG